MAVKAIISYERGPTTADVSFVGDLDVTGGRSAKKILASCISDGRVDLSIDLNRVGVLDSTGLGALIGALRLARERGGRVRLIAEQPQIRRLLEITGLTRVFGLAAHTSAA